MSNVALALMLLLPYPLTEQMGSRSYRIRHRATNALVAFGKSALPCLELNSKTHKDPEVRERCAYLLRPYAYEIAERDSHVILPTSYPRLPWIGIEDWGVWEELEPYLSVAKTKGLKGAGQAPDWPEYREASRLWIRSQILQNRPMQEIIDRLDIWTNMEINWIRMHGSEYKPAITLPHGVHR